jgi:quercetin dioxygenase-like cupin family protein
MLADRISGKADVALYISDYRVTQALHGESLFLHGPSAAERALDAEDRPDLHYLRRILMRKHVAIPSIAVVIMGAIVFMSAPSPVNAQQVDVQRKILLQQDLPIPGYEVVQALATVAPGAREGKHTHPGTLVGYVLEGTMILEREGQQPATYNVGDSFVVETGVVHEGINNGKVPYKVEATYIVPKGKLLTTPVK